LLDGVEALGHESGPAHEDLVRADGRPVILEGAHATADKFVDLNIPRSTSPGGRAKVNCPRGVVARRCWPLTAPESETSSDRLRVALSTTPFESTATAMAV